MIIVCPKCGTSFAVPDEIYKPGRKARCSQCSNVFAMPENTPQDPGLTLQKDEPKPKDSPLPKEEAKSSEPESKKKRNIKKIVVLGTVLVLCLLGLSLGSYMIYGSYKAASLAKQEEKAAKEAQARREARLKEGKIREEQDRAVSQIKPIDVTQVVVNNNVLGPLVVVTGKMRNDFEEPRDEIMVEVRLLNEAGKVLASTVMPCGIKVTLVQLEALTERELQAVLSNMTNIIANNTYITKGETTPFCVVFKGIPEGFATFEVRPVSAKVSPPSPPIGS